MGTESTIKKVMAYECLDSRGNPTLAVELTLQDGSSAQALVPSGASTGEFEAHELRDGDPERYLGKGVQTALKNITSVISEKLIGCDSLDLRGIDSLLIDLDGTANKSKLGANSILGISLAAAHVGAQQLGIPLFEHLARIYEYDLGQALLPVPLVNVINGGAHASNSIDFQEFMLVPHGFANFSDSIRAAAEVFHCLRKNLLKQKLSTGLGDEGGFAPNLPSAEAAIELLLNSISDAGYNPGEHISLALDVAASEFYDKDKNLYILSKSTGAEMSAKDLIGLYSDWLKKYPLVSIEDGLAEDDWEGWETLTRELGAQLQLVGDDLLVTNVKRLQTGIEKKAANSILIKLNQIGSVSETMDAIKLAQENSWSCVISHRSGETEDTSIADLAVAVGAGQIKTGSVSRGERTAKYNRLLYIENTVASSSLASPFKS